MVSNSFLALAGHDLHVKASALMASADELPDEVLDSIEFLIRSAMDRKTPYGFYRKIREFNRSGVATEVGYDERFIAFKKSVSEMRKELQDIFGEMHALWMNWVIN